MKGPTLLSTATAFQLSTVLEYHSFIKNGMIPKKKYDKNILRIGFEVLFPPVGASLLLHNVPPCSTLVVQVSTSVLLLSRGIADRTVGDCPFFGCSQGLSCSNTIIV